jgi:hypothetical protein
MVPRFWARAAGAASISTSSADALHDRAGTSRPSVVANALLAVLASFDCLPRVIGFSSTRWISRGAWDVAHPREPAARVEPSCATDTLSETTEGEYVDEPLEPFVGSLRIAQARRREKVGRRRGGYAPGAVRPSLETAPAFACHGS